MRHLDISPILAPFVRLAKYNVILNRGFTLHKIGMTTDPAY